jgi:hypothetical protein
MTILYPSLGSAELLPYEAPFGRMMLAYGRAIAATIALVTTYKDNEAEAVLFVTEAGTKELPKRVRRVFRHKLKDNHYEQLDKAMTSLKALAEKRHQLIHGEWWFNVFKNGELTIRGVRSQRSSKKNNDVSLTIGHRNSVSIHDLNEWAKELNEIADVLDNIEHRFRNTRTGK